MKKIALFIFFSASLSCGREDMFLKNDDLPVVSLSKNNTEFVSQIYDTVKLNRSLLYYIRSIDNQNTRLLFSQQAADSISIESNRITILTYATGDNTVTVKCLDIYNVYAEAYIYLNVFANQPPVSVLSVINTAVLDPYEVEMDASKSYDRDSRFGGKVINYEFTLQGGYKFTTPLSKIKYIFQDGGQKSVSVRVQDNDNAWSDPSVKYIVL